LPPPFAVAYSSFRTKVPNGDSSPGNCYAWGHSNCGGGGSRWSGSSNVAAWSGWTSSACTTDSDGDGWSNGDELGDACCTWTWGAGAPPDLDSSGGSDGRISNPRNPASTPTTSTRASHMRQSFALQAPGTTSLQAVVSGSTIALSWISAPGACSYQVKVSVNSGAYTTVYDSTSTPMMDAGTSATYTMTSYGSHIFSVEPVNLHSTGSAATAYVHNTAAEPEAPPPLPSSSPSPAAPPVQPPSPSSPPPSSPPASSSPAPTPHVPSLRISSPLPPPSPAPSCVCASNPSAYATFNNQAACFGANDMTNLEMMFSGQALPESMRAFYTRCSDYDNDGTFRANDLTNMKRYYAQVLPMAMHFSRDSRLGRAIGAG